MKTTGEWCFGTNMMSCALQLEKWQETNCRVCPKARFFNEKTGRMPKYYCAIQEQIEEQAGGVSRWVNVRTYDAVHEQTTCKFIGKRDDEPQEQHVVIDAHEFEKGHRIVSVDVASGQDKTTTQVIDTQAEETDDAMLDFGETSVMQNETTKSVFFDGLKQAMTGDLSQQGIRELARKTAKQVAGNVTMDDELRRKYDEVAARIAADGCIPGMTETQFKQKIHDDVKQISEAFTFEEHKQIAYTPLVLQHVAWDYAIRARRMAADLRISETKKLCRAVDEIHKQLLDTLAKDLDKKHRDRLLDAAKEWMTDTGNDQTILWLQVTQAYMTQRPEDGYRDLRVLAMCAILLAEWIFDYQEKIDVMVAERLHTELTPIPWPHLKGMVELMNGFIQDMTIERNQQIETCMRVMTNRMNKIKWIE